MPCNRSRAIVGGKEKELTSVDVYKGIRRLQLAGVTSQRAAAYCPSNFPMIFYRIPNPPSSLRSVLMDGFAFPFSGLLISDCASPVFFADSCWLMFAAARINERLLDRILRFQSVVFRSKIGILKLLIHKITKFAHFSPSFLPRYQLPYRIPSVSTLRYRR